jgi:hypothetical protein
MDKYTIESTFSLIDTEHKRFRKDILKVGKWYPRTHPQGIDINSERLKAIFSDTKKYISNGNRVDITTDHSDSAKNNYGFLNSFEFDNTTLFGVFDFADDEGVKLAKRNQRVSVDLVKNHKDGAGNIYNEIITAASIVQEPVVTDQSDFVEFSMVKPKQQKDNKDMKVIDALKTEFGLADLTEENAVEKVKGLIKSKADEEKESVKFSLIKEAGLDSVEGETLAEKAKVKFGFTMPDAELMEVKKELFSMKGNKLVEDNNIIPAVKDKLLDLALDSKVMFSKHGEGDEAKEIIAKVFDILSENDVVEFGMKSKKQADENTKKDLEDANKTIKKHIK